eukprot:4397660-Prymnesium_polylepis.1
MEKTFNTRVQDILVRVAADSDTANAGRSEVTKREARPRETFCLLRFGTSSALHTRPVAWVTARVTRQSYSAVTLS